MRGIDKFKERFAGHDGEYVLIGGGACDLLFGEAGQDFRATKDLDLVLLVEALTPEFGQVFWDFVKEGGYENRQKSSRKPQFYRFSKPEDPAFPAMLELFARTDVDLRDAESGLMPIHIDDEVSSLSDKRGWRFLNKGYSVGFQGIQANASKQVCPTAAYLLATWASFHSSRISGCQISGRL